jgi:beta-glucanase (GH16 family)
MSAVPLVVSRSAAPRRSRRGAGLVVRALAVAAALMVALSALVPVAAAGASDRVPAPGRWHLLFDASFSGRHLDHSLWHTCYDGGQCRIPTNPEFETYAPSGIKVTKGQLELTARPQPTSGQPFSSGMVQSNGRFDFTYGFMEVRAKIPPTVGTWPAIWMAPSNHQWPPEIDVMEAWGARADQARQSVFLPTNTDGIHHNVSIPGQPAGFHTYAVDWEPGVITWYVDGRPTFRYQAAVDISMYVILNLAVANPVVEDGGYPATFTVDWVRVYQHPGVGSDACTVPRACPGTH